MLDFGLAPVRDHTKVWVRLPPETEAAITALPGTAARIEMALRFCTKIANLEGSDEADLRLREGYMRASLAELVSVEDTLKWERPQEPFELWWSQNPLLHVLRELRNLNVHLKPSKFDSREIVVRMAAPGSDDVPINIHLVRDFTVEAFKKLRNSKRYTDQQAVDMVAWFNDFQQHWGIADAIHQGICSTAEILVQKYNLVA